MKSREFLIALNEKYKGNWKDIFTAISNREEISDDEFYDLMLNINLDKFITILDEDYPDWLKKFYHPPFVLYRNDLDAFENMYNFCKPLIGGDNSGD